MLLVPVLLSLLPIPSPFPITILLSGFFLFFLFKKFTVPFLSLHSCLVLCPIFETVDMTSGVICCYKQVVQPIDVSTFSISLSPSACLSILITLPYSLSYFFAVYVPLPVSIFILPLLFLCPFVLLPDPISSSTSLSFSLYHSGSAPQPFSLILLFHL